MSMTVAQRDPGMLRNMFIDNGDGSFTVKLFKDNQPQYVTVDRYLPTDATGKLVFAQVGAAANNPGNILWPALLEKAIAQVAESGWLPENASNTINSYRSIDGGSSGNTLWTAEVLGLLTGRGFTGGQITPDSLSDMLDAYNNNEFVTVTANHPFAVYGSLTLPTIATGRTYTILSYTTAKGGSFKLLAVTGSGTATDVAGHTVPGIITLTTAQFLANMQFYETTTSDLL